MRDVSVASRLLPFAAGMATPVVLLVYAMRLPSAEAHPRRYDVVSMVGEKVTLDGGGVVEVDQPFGPGPVVLQEAIAWVESDPYGKIARGEATLTLSGMPAGCALSGSPEGDAGSATRWRYVFTCPRVDGGGAP